MSKNCIESDIEIEDDIIFGNDDNDSLSSAGICHATTISKGSHSTLVINSNNTKSIGNMLVTIEDVEHRVSSSHMLARPRSLSNTHYLVEPAGQLKLSSSMDNNCMRLARLEPATSISDIDPDENILKNLLIKNANKNH